MNRNTAAAVGSNKRKGDEDKILTWELLIGYAFVWGYVLVGAAVLRKLENDSPHRQTPPALPDIVYELADGTNYTVPAPAPTDELGRLIVYYPQLTFLDATYWMFVTLTTMGFGDIVPTRNGSRAFIFCWGIIGVSLVALLVVQIVNFVLTNAYRALGSRVKRGMRSKATTGRLRRILASFVVRIAVALAMYIGWLLVGAAIFSHTEKHSKDSIDDGAPWSFRNGVYFCYIASATVGFGTDYSLSTSRGRLIYLFYFQVALLLQLLVFSNVFTLVLTRLHRTFRERIILRLSQQGGVTQTQPSTAASRPEGKQ